MKSLEPIFNSNSSIRAELEGIRSRLFVFCQDQICVMSCISNWTNNCLSFDLSFRSELVYPIGINSVFNLNL